MNPPFTSDTKHYDAADGVLNAAFAAYDSSEADQDEMANRLKILSKGTVYHGHAGLGSAFASLAYRKLRPGGVIALVLPFSAVIGSSWAKFRQLVSSHCYERSIVSIAAGKDAEMSFSTDTDIGECLVIARKNYVDNPQPGRAEFTSLARRPQGLAASSAIANRITQQDSVRTVESGPFGGIPLLIGEELAGESLDAPTGEYGSRWGSARIKDASVAQVAQSLSASKLWLPAHGNPLKLPTAQLDQVARRGVDSQLLTHVTHGMRKMVD